MISFKFKTMRKEILTNKFDLSLINFSVNTDYCKTIALLQACFQKKARLTYLIGKVCLLMKRVLFQQIYINKKIMSRLSFVCQQQLVVVKIVYVQNRKHEVLIPSQFVIILRDLESTSVRNLMSNQSIHSNKYWDFARTSIG